MTLRFVQGDKPLLERNRNQFCAGGNVELGENVGKMPLYCAVTDGELLGDLTVCATFGDSAYDLQFAPAQNGPTAPTGECCRPKPATVLHQARD